MPQTHRTAINRANAERQNDSFWTERRVRTLIKLRDRGFSASEIAKQIGDGATRSMVAGKSWRLGLEAIRVSRETPHADVVAPKRDPLLERLRALSKGGVA